MDSMFRNKDRDEELSKLRDEIEDLKEQLRGISEELEQKEEKVEDHYPRRDYDLRSDLGDRISDYVTSIIDSVMNGIAGELDRSIFIGPRRIGVSKERKSRKKVRVDPKRAAEVMSALGNEHRISVLEELTSGGLYAGELRERLSEISASTLSSHLDVLERTGLIVQEKARGRYLITIPGRLAYRMANQIAHQIDEVGE